MAGKACLLYWLSITRVILTATDHSVHTALPNECLNVKLDGLKPYLPQSLLTDERIYLCQKPWGEGSSGKQLDVAEKEVVQYLTLFDKTHRIPIYSAYVAEPWIKESGEWVDQDRRQIKKDKNGKITSSLNRSPNWKDRNEKEFAQSADYTGWDSIDRGHLFPVQLTKDWIENKATNKITNTVPQDATFNEQQWKTAETLLKDVAIKRCQTEEGKAFIITGSVPDYYGGKVQEPFKIGCEDENTKICPRHRMRVTVPTHIWTTLRCMKKDTKTKGRGGKSETIFHTSFIGSNEKDGKVVWYKKFSSFEKDLLLMLKVKTPLFTEKPKDGTITEMVYKEMGKDFKGSQSFHKQDQEYADWHTGPTCDLYAIRKSNFIQRLMKEFQHIGLGITQIFTSVLPNTLKHPLTSVSPSTCMIPAKKQKIKKREVHSPKETSNYFLLELEDNDPDADIEVSKILIKETYQNCEEVQTLDLAGKQIIADRNNRNANKFTASVNIDGEETELAEIPSTEKFIRIELKPRS